MSKLFLKQGIMNKVLYALIPITIFSIFLFGWRVLFILAITNIFAAITEYAFIRKRKNGRISMAVFVTGSLLALILPPTVPFWIAAVGAVFGVAFGKMVFGGFGMNVFNPAIVGRTFVYISFPKAMTITWLEPFQSLPGGFAVFQRSEMITKATPMTILENSNTNLPLTDLFWGFIPGSAGETSAVLILLAGIYLILTKTAKWQPILSLLASFIVFSFIFNGLNTIYLILSGGVLFGTVFMITDPISMPKNKYSIWLYGIIVGFLTVIIRKYSLFTEGFMFALLIANVFMPIIDYSFNKLKIK